MRLRLGVRRGIYCHGQIFAHIVDPDTFSRPPLASSWSQPKYLAEEKEAPDARDQPRSPGWAGSPDRGRPRHADARAVRCPDPGARRRSQPDRLVAPEDRALPGPAAV